MEKYLCELSVISTVSLFCQSGYTVVAWHVENSLVHDRNDILYEMKESFFVNSQVHFNS